jgi:rhodanese-related sulfurtransferase
MKEFDELLRQYDLKYFGSGSHKISFDKMMALKKEGRAYILDVRTSEENELVKFEFANNIPTCEIPERLGEIPLDQTIVVFCTSTTRATIVSVYLQLRGYKAVKILADGIGDIAGSFKPGYVLTNIEALQNVMKKRKSNSNISVND